IVIVCLAPVSAANLYIDVLYVKSFVRIGGRGFWTDAIYDLTEFAKAHPERRFILPEWGFNNQLLLRSNGNISKEDISGATASDDDSLSTILAELFKNPDNIYVLYAPPYHPRTEVSRFYDTVKNQHRLEKVYQCFKQRDNQPVYIL